MNISIIEGKIAKCDDEITGLINDIDSIMKKLMGDTADTGLVTDYGGKVLNSSAFVKLNYNGITYNIVNTPISVSNLYSHINKYRLTQTGHLSEPKYNSGCLGVAAGYGYRLLQGTKLTTDMANYYTYRHYDDYYTTSKTSALNTIYHELSNGKPCVLQVEGSSGRHYVTVVGMKSNVTSANELNEEDLLIIDAWNGKIQPLEKEKSTYESGDRYMYAQREYLDPVTGKKTANLSSDKFYRVCTFNS